MQKRRYSAKKTYNLIDPTDRSHPIPYVAHLWRDHTWRQIYDAETKSIFIATFMNTFIRKKSTRILIYVHLYPHAYPHVYLYINVYSHVYSRAETRSIYIPTFESGRISTFVFTWISTLMGWLRLVGSLK